MATGLTGDQIHTGSWGTPDLGVTEYLSNLFGQGRTATGGSNLQGPVAETTLAPVSGGGFTQAVQPISPVNTSTNTTKTVTQQPAQQTQQTSGLDPHINRATGQWDDNYYASHSGASSGGPSQADIQNQINALYEPSFQYLSQAEQNLQSDYPNVVSGIQGQFDVNSKTLADQNTTGNQQLSTNANQAYNRKEDALSAARRLYDELRRGYSQRFGGSTSAGTAASELASVEQQRQMGATQRSYGDTMAQIEYQKADLARGYSTATLKLKTDTDTAKNQAYSDFQNKLLQIQQSKSQIASAKAASSLDALNQYRNQLFAINQQNLQFAQTLQLQQAQASTAIDTYAKQLALAGQGSQAALDLLAGKTTTNPSSAYVVGGNTGATNASAMTGQINGLTKHTDPYGNVYYS